MIITTALFLLWIKIHNAKVEFIVCCSNRYSLHFSRLSMNHIQTFTCRSFFYVISGEYLTTLPDDDEEQDYLAVCGLFSAICKSVESLAIFCILIDIVLYLDY